MCTKQDQEREQGIQLPVSHTLSDHYYICDGNLACHLGAMSGMEVFSIKHELHVNGYSIIDMFYHLNKMLIATKHIADNNFIFQQDSIWYAT